MTFGRTFPPFLLLLLTLALPVSAQRGSRSSLPDNPGPGQTGRNPDIQVRVRLNRSSLQEQVQVELLGQGGNAVMRMFTDSSGNVTFGSVPSGVYRLKITGMNIQPYEGTTFEVYPGEFTHFENAEVQLKPSANAGSQVTTGFVSAHDAAAPANARKEYEQGIKEFTDKKIDKAQQHLEKAISEYEQYDSAYVALGGIYLLQKDKAKAEEIYRKGLAIAPENPRLQGALGRVLLQQNNVADAEPLLKKSVAADSSSEGNMALLVRAEYQKNNCDDVFRYAKKVHEMSPHKEAFVHLLAGSCYENLNRPADAVTEYEVFLKESPDNSNAPVARERIKAIADSADKFAGKK